MDKSILEVVHESAKGLYDTGIVDATTMHEFDALPNARWKSYCAGSRC